MPRQRPPSVSASGTPESYRPSGRALRANTAGCRLTVHVHPSALQSAPSQPMCLPCPDTQGMASPPTDRA